MKICAAVGCDLAAYGRPYCNKHYLRWRRHGDPLAGRTPNGAGAAFLASALTIETAACIDWPFGCSQGYGETQYKGAVRLAHALVCEFIHGPKPIPAHEAAHSCGRRVCINHRHLRWATRAENIQDSIDHGTKPRGEKHSAARLTEANVRDIRAMRGTATQDEIAAAFGVHRAHVKDIQMRRRWAWLD